MVNSGKVAINLAPWVELKLGVVLARNLALYSGTKCGDGTLLMLHSKS